MPSNIDFPERQEVIFERDAIAFPAVVDGKTIKCVISTETLNFRFNAPRGAEMPVFLEHRSKFEMLAATKIRAGEIENDEVGITTKDFPL